MGDRINEIEKALMIIGSISVSILVLVIGIAYKLEIFWWQ